MNSESINTQWRYVNAHCESIPFEDSTFDVVTSMNSLDHVDDISKSISEIGRVLKPGGMFLLLTDIHEHPTRLEPQAFSWNILDQFSGFISKSVQQLEKSDPKNIYESVKLKKEFDFDNAQARYGILLARFLKE